MGNSDRIGKLDLTLIGKSCYNDVLSNITCCVGCGTIHLCAVLSGEGAAAVTGISAVGVYDDLSACKSAVSVRAADNETSCRVDKELRLRIYHFLRKDLIEHILFNVFMDLLLCYGLIVLRGKNDGVKAERLAVFIVFNGNLCLSIRT